MAKQFKLYNNRTKQIDTCVLTTTEDMQEFSASDAELDKQALNAYVHKTQAQPKVTTPNRQFGASLEPDMREAYNILRKAGKI